MKVTLLENTRIAVGRAIEEALDRAESFDAAVAFVKRSGLGAAPALQEFARTKPLRILAGTDFSQTEVEAVDELSRSGAESRVFVEGLARTNPPASARTFHPKVYLATRPDSLIAIIGSSNLTRGGLVTNHEACLRVEGHPDEPVLRDTVEYFQTLWTNPYSIPVDDVFRLQYRRFKDARRHAEAAVRDDDAERVISKVLRTHLASLVTGGPARSRTTNPKLWVLVTSLANFEVCKDLQQWGDIKEGQIRKLQTGDAVVFYLKKVKRIAGLGLVRGLPFPLESNPWPEGTYTWGLKVDFLLSPDTTIDFIPLIPELQFIQNKAAWGTHLQGFMHQVPYHDFEIMRQALADATIGTALPRVAESG